MDVFTLAGKLTLDGADKVQGQLKGTVDRAAQAQKALKLVGTALTAVGAAGLAMVASTKKINAELATMGLTIGLNAKEMRGLVLDVTNVTFGLESVKNTFDLLIRAGVENSEMLKASANAFDALADATGNEASALAGILIPAFKNFGEALPTTSAELDKFTWLTKNTQIELAGFGSMMSYVAQYGADLDITLEDMIGILAALDAQGKSSSTITKIFRTAVTQAASGVTTFNDALGLTQGEIDGYKTKMDGANGLTKESADLMNEQFTIMDKLKQKWAEITLGASGFLEPLEPILAGMTALGPLMIFLSTQAGIAAAKWTAHALAVTATNIALAFTNPLLIVHKVVMLASVIATHAATAATWLWNAALTVATGGINLIIPLIAALVVSVIALWKNWDKVSTIFMSTHDKLIRASAETIAALEEEKDALDEKHKAEMDAIKEEYAGYEEITNLKIEQAEILQEVESNALDARLKGANEARAELLRGEDGYTEQILASIDDRMEATRREFDERRVKAKAEYDEAVDAINEKYGKIEDIEEKATDSLIDEAIKRSEAVQKGYDKDVDAARDAARQVLDAWLAGELSKYDIAERNRLKGLQDQIDGINDATEAEDLAAARAAEKQKLLDLKSVIDSAETDEEKAAATEAFTEYETEVKRKELLRQRAAQKDSLRDEMDAIRDASAANRANEESRLDKEYREKKIASDKILNEITIPAIEDKKVEEDNALAQSLLDIEANRVSALDINDLKYTNPEKNGIFDLMDKEQEERTAAYAAELIDAEKQRIAINEEFGKIITRYDIDIVTHYSTEGDTGVANDDGTSGGASQGVVKTYANGGRIDEPTWLTRVGETQPYGIMAEKKSEFITNGGGTGGAASGFKTANITLEIDGRTLARAMGQPLIEEIRLKTGIK